MKKLQQPISFKDITPIEIRCVDSSFATDHLTEGKIYRADGIYCKNDSADDRYRIIDDNGQEWYPFCERFKLI